MSKPRVYGMTGKYTPNSKMDMWNRQKVYQRGRELAERAEDHAAEARERKALKELEAMKYGKSETV